MFVFFVVVVVVLNNPPSPLNAAYMCTDVVPSTETWATTRVMPLKINEFPSFSSNLLPIALQFGVRLCVPPSPCWNIDWFDIVRLLCISPQLLWVRGYRSHVMSRIDCFIAFLPNLWLLRSFCHFFRDVWDSGGGGSCGINACLELSTPLGLEPVWVSVLTTTHCEKNLVPFCFVMPVSYITWYRSPCLPLEAFTRDSILPVVWCDAVTPLRWDMKGLSLPKWPLSSFYLWQLSLLMRVFFRLKACSSIQGLSLLSVAMVMYLF